MTTEGETMNEDSVTAKEARAIVNNFQEELFKLNDVEIEAYQIMNFQILASAKEGKRSIELDVLLPHMSAKRMSRCFQDNGFDVEIKISNYVRYLRISW